MSQTFHIRAIQDKRQTVMPFAKTLCGAEPTRIDSYPEFLTGRISNHALCEKCKKINEGKNEN